MEEVKRKEQELPPKNEERKKEKGKEDILQYRSPEEGFFFLLIHGKGFPRPRGAFTSKRGGKFNLSPSHGCESNIDPHTHKKRKGRLGVPSDPDLTFFCVCGGRWLRPSMLLRRAPVTLNPKP